jgi:hypothetical protein
MRQSVSQGRSRRAGRTLLMRRASLALALLSVLAPAHAQTRSPEITSLALPLALTASLERHAEMGCSQSFQSSQGTAQIALAIDRGGAARLTLDGDYGSTTGPSPGRYMAGDHDVSHVREVHRSLWSGHADVVAGAVVVDFERVDAAEMRTSGYGTLPLPAPTTRAFHAQLRCRIERLDVLPSTPAASEVATPMDLLRCAWAGEAPEPFARYSDQTAWALGVGAGVQNLADTNPWGSAIAHQVRLR